MDQESANPKLKIASLLYPMQSELRNLFSTSTVFNTGRVNEGLSNPSSNRFGKSHVFLQYTCFALLLFGIKLWVINEYGNATPFWDQWDAEAVHLYKPYLDGTISWDNLISQHNEHRIVTTRILALYLLYMNKIWNPLLQMVVNAGLHIISLLLFNSLLIKVIGRNNLPALLAFSLILFGIPYGWENILAGFQAQFYFVLLFSTGALWLLVMKPPFSGKWWAGIICATLAFLSLASGVFAFGAAALVGLLLYIINLRKSIRQLVAVTIVSGLFLVGIFLTPRLEHQAVYKAHSLGQLYHAVLTVLGWPIGFNVFSALIRNLPMGIFVICVLKNRPAANHRKWFLFALCVWSIAQVLSMAYARANGILSSRYKDFYAIPIFINFACLISLAEIYVAKTSRNRMWLAVATWVTIVLFSLGRNSGKYLPYELDWKRRTGNAQQENTKNYVQTGNSDYLKGKQEFDIPYPKPERLAEIIELPGIREILPSNINGSLKLMSINIKPNIAFKANGYYFPTPRQPDTCWGSYTEEGDKSMGEMSLRFHSNLKYVNIGVPIAGYPIHEGIKLVIEQNSETRPLTIKANPGESWGRAYGKIEAGDFTLHLVDSSVTEGGWIAVGKPLVLGRFDALNDRLLSHYYLFLTGGFIIIIFLITRANILRSSRSSAAIADT